MKKRILIPLVTFLLLAGANLTAQKYNTAVGLRFGWFYGVSVKHNFNSKNAIEGFLTSHYRGATLVGLYEWNKPTPTENLNFFFGVGGHLSSYNRYYYYHPKHEGYRAGRIVTVGLDGILGLEYSFDFPLNVSLDVHPYIDLYGWNGNLMDFALSARYYF